MFSTGLGSICVEIKLHVFLIKTGWTVVRGFKIINLTARLQDGPSRWKNGFDEMPENRDPNEEAVFRRGCFKRPVSYDG